MSRLRDVCNYYVFNKDNVLYPNRHTSKRKQYGLLDEALNECLVQAKRHQSFTLIRVRMLQRCCLELRLTKWYSNLVQHQLEGRCICFFVQSVPADWRHSWGHSFIFPLPAGQILALVNAPTPLQCFPLIMQTNCLHPPELI